MFPDWFDVLRSSRVNGFDSAVSGDEIDELPENEMDSSGRARPFRPWQVQSRPDSEVTAYQADADADLSDSSVVQPTQFATQTVRKKVYSKSKQKVSELSQSRKMTVRVGEKMKKAKTTKFVWLLGRLYVIQ